MTGIGFCVLDKSLDARLEVAPGHQNVAVTREALNTDVRTDPLDAPEFPATGMRFAQFYHITGL
jgi:hypothetical protein